MHPYLAWIPLPEDLPAGSYTLRLFDETEGAVELQRRSVVRDVRPPQAEVQPPKTVTPYVPKTPEQEKADEAAKRAGVSKIRLGPDAICESQRNPVVRFREMFEAMPEMQVFAGQRAAQHALQVRDRRALGQLERQALRLAADGIEEIQQESWQVVIEPRQCGHVRLPGCSS